MKKIRRKLCSRRGMSLSELLAALLIMSLVTIGVATGVSAALRTYRQSVAQSDAQMLASTLTSALMDELRYARDIKTEGPAFTSDTYGENVTVKPSDDGYLCVGDQLLVGKGAYAVTLRAKMTEFKYDGSKFNVKLTICEGDKEIRTVEFSVTPLNG